MRGESVGQGIDISYNIRPGMTLVDGCTVVGGQEGIVTHSSMAMLRTITCAGRDCAESR